MGTSSIRTSVGHYCFHLASRRSNGSPNDILQTECDGLYRDWIDMMRLERSFPCPISAKIALGKAVMSVTHITVHATSQVSRLACS